MGQVQAGAAAWSILPTLEFIASQAALLTPLIFAGLLWGVIRCVRAGFKEGGGGLMLVFFTSAPLFFFFVLKGLHGKVQANWAVASYAAAMPAAVWAFLSAYEKAGRAKRRALSAALVIGLALGILFTLAAYFPWALERAGAKDILWGPPYNRVTAWGELGDKVREAREELARTGETFVMSDTYQITSELAFYTKGNPRAFYVNTGGRRMNQYDLWPGLETVTGQNAVYVKGGDEEIEPGVENAFDTCDKEVFEIFHKGRVLKEFSIFRCVNFKGMEAASVEGLKY
jgi:undecaprenyl-diphosphatase